MLSTNKYFAVISVVQDNGTPYIKPSIVAVISDITHFAELNLTSSLCRFGLYDPISVKDAVEIANEIHGQTGRHVILSYVHANGIVSSYEWFAKKC